VACSPETDATQTLNVFHRSYYPKFDAGGFTHNVGARREADCGTDVLPPLLGYKRIFGSVLPLKDLRLKYRT